MSGLEALLLTGIDDELPLNKFFPYDYNDHKTITELLIISEYFKNCGKGSLQHKNKIFYYRTYIPTIPKPEGISLSNESFSDYFIYSYDCNRKKFLLLFLCDLNYKQKNIDLLSHEVFDVLDNNAFEKHDIKQESCNKINILFEKYKKKEPNLSKNNSLKELNTINDSSDSINISSNDEKTKKNNISFKKRIDSRMILPKVKKSKSDSVSVDIDDLTTVRESDTDLSKMFKQTYDKDLFLPQINKWKTIKLWNIFLCLILFVIMLIVVYFILK
jgi:hypothetical protein